MEQAQWHGARTEWNCFECVRTRRTGCPHHFDGVLYFTPVNLPRPQPSTTSNDKRICQMATLPIHAFAGLSEARKLLKRTSVNVTRRKVAVDGSMVYVKEIERSVAGGGFKKVQGSERLVAAPSHLVEEVADRTALTPKAYDPQTGAWGPLPPKLITKHSPSTEVNLRLMQQNVWFADIYFHARALMLLQMIQNESPDIVALQEVTPRLLELVKQNGHIQQHFILSDSTATSLAPYGCLMLVRKGLYEHSHQRSVFMLYHLPTTMARRMVGISLEIFSGVSVFFGTVHLDSMQSSTSCVVRQAQLHEIFNVQSQADIAESTNQALWSAGVVAGDFNFDTTDPEQQTLDLLMEGNRGQSHRLVDAWTAGSSCEDRCGANTTTLHNKNKRIDRCMLRSNSLVDITARCVRRIGLEQLACSMQNETCFPSDHIGLVTDLSFLGKK